MEINIYAYRKLQEKIFVEGKLSAEALILHEGKNENYYGNEHVAKVKRHDGTNMYYVSEAVMTEIMEYIRLRENAIEYAVSRNSSKLNPTLSAALQFISYLRIDENVQKSIEKCYKGQPMMNFYRDFQKIETDKEAERAKQDVVALWSF